MNNSRTLVQSIFRGEATDRLAVGPLAVHYCAYQAGVSLKQYTLDPHTLADCVVRYYDEFHPDAVWLSADTWVSAQAMGAPVTFPGENQPLSGTGRPCVRSMADLERIPSPDPGEHGRWPVMLEALRIVRKALERVFIVACFDQYPFSLACALMGIERVMLSLADDRSMLDAIMERCAQSAVAYGRALVDAGADMLSGGDSPAGLLGPRFYRQIALPGEQQVISQLHSQVSVPISLHICGDATPILADMATSGADVLELDHQVDLRDACRMTGPNTTIWGNLDPVGLLTRGTPEQVHQATLDLIRTAVDTGHARLVISSGCTLAAETPSENLQAMIDAVQRSPYTSGTRATTEENAA